MRRLAAAVALGLLLGLVGAGFGARSLYLAGIALLLSGIAAWGWVHFVSRAVRLTRSLSRRVIEESRPLPVAVVTSGARARLPGVELRVWPGAPPQPLPRPPFARVTGEVRFPRRGRHRLGPATLRVSDPLRLCSREISSAVDEVLVLPRIEPVRFVQPGTGSALTGRWTTRAVPSDSSEVDSLRPHRSGTPASRIHWPTVARTSVLMERRLVADGDLVPLVVVDPRRPASSSSLDQAIRAAASLCMHLARAGGCALLLPGDRRPTRIDAALHGFADAHARLALVSPDDGGPSCAPVAEFLTVLWVTAAVSPPPAVEHVRASARFLVSPCAQTQWPVEFTVAGCSGQRLDRAWVARNLA